VGNITPFGQDKKYLREVAYPIMKETVEFWQDHLKKLAMAGWSCQRLVAGTRANRRWRQLFAGDRSGTCSTTMCRLGDALDVDHDYRDQVKRMRDHLGQAGIGSCISCWSGCRRARQELDTPTIIIGIRRISSVSTRVGRSTCKPRPISAAAKVSLDARGHRRRSRVVFRLANRAWARLGESEKATARWLKLLSNRKPARILFGLHPPSKSTATSASPQASPRCCCKARMGRFIFCRVAEGVG